MKGIRFYKSSALNSIEIKECSNTIHSSRTHFHEELSIGFINKGSTVLLINNVKYSLSSGDIIIIYPFVNHQCMPLDYKNWDFKMYYLESGVYDNKYKDIDFRNTVRIFQENIKGYSDLKKFEKLVDSSSSSGKIDSDLDFLFKYIFDPAYFDNDKIAPDKIDSVRIYIRDNFLDSFLLSKIEENFRINKFTLIREFKKSFNTTPNAYQIELKINYAKKLLKTRSDIAGIALDAGFYDQPHLTKEFKNAYGISPMEYRNSILG